jgi:hypothetical protein
MDLFKLSFPGTAPRFQVRQYEASNASVFNYKRYLKVRHFFEKRQKRIWAERKIEVRKEVANKRPRIAGRFIGKHEQVKEPEVITLEETKHTAAKGKPKKPKEPPKGPKEKRNTKKETKSKLKEASRRKRKPPAVEVEQH